MIGLLAPNSLQCAAYCMWHFNCANQVLLIALLPAVGMHALIQKSQLELYLKFLYLITQSL